MRCAVSDFVLYWHLMHSIISVEVFNSEIDSELTGSMVDDNRQTSSAICHCIVSLWAFGVYDLMLYPMSYHNRLQHLGHDENRH